MTVTAEQTQRKKRQREEWAKDARAIAQKLLTLGEMKKKAWKLDVMTEDELRFGIEKRNAKIAAHSKKRRKITQPTKPEPALATPSPDSLTSAAPPQTTE